MTNFHDNIADLTSSFVKKNLTYASIPEWERWRISVIKGMQDILGNRDNGMITKDINMNKKFVNWLKIPSKNFSDFKSKFD